MTENAGLIQSVYQRIAEHLQPTSFEPEMYVTEGDQVMTKSSRTCTVKANGVSFRSPWAMHFRNTDDKTA
jgi:ketosteroid isomerase-like protein